MSEDLLAKEKEFHRLNKELEEKTRELMKEVDSVMESTNNSQLLSLNEQYSFTYENNINKKLLDAPTLMERQSNNFLLNKQISLPQFSEDYQHQLQTK